MHLCFVLENKLVHIKLPLTTGIIHIPDLPKYFPLSPALRNRNTEYELAADICVDLIMDASDAPHNTNISVGIVAVQSIAVVEPGRRFIL